MKRFFLFLILLFGLLAGAVQFYALPKAKIHIETALKNSGFSYANSSNFTFKPTGLAISSISIDPDGFSKIEGLKANIYWPTYFYKKQIDAINIDKVSIYSSDNKLSNLSNLKRNLNFSAIDTFQIQRILVNKIEWNFPLFDKAIQIDAQLNLVRENQQKNITLDLQAQQHELSFSSKLTGKFDSNGNQALEATIEDFKLNIPSLSLHRSNGWLSYKKANKETEFSGQLEAGSGSIFTVPTKNISFIISQEENYYPLIIRAFAGGIENVRLSADIRLSKDTSYQNGQARLSIPDFQEFLDYIKSQNIINNAPITSSEPLDLTLSLMPERRFADGPLPFQIQVTRRSNEELSGTFLIYPSSLDIRGNLSSNADFLGVIKSVTPIKDQQIKENIIHLDNNMRSLIF